MAKITRSEDVPVTQKMLYGVRNELNSKFMSLEKRIDAVESRLMGEFHRLGVLVEEQNARNRVVMDGLVNLFERQDRIEKTVAEKLG